MNDGNFLFILSILVHSAISSGTSILFATLGEIITEKSGIINLGVEGVMLIGAVIGFLVSYYTSSPLIGFLAAGLAGGVFVLLHAIAAITFKANQIVSGLALTILGTGLSSFIGYNLVGKVANSFKEISLPIFGKIPLLGYALFKHNVLVYFAYVLVFLIGFLLFKTRFGLYIQVIGDAPHTALSNGIDVEKYQYFSVFLGGILMAFGGAYLSLADTPSWTDNMTAGRGWIALALVIFSTWNPYKAIIASYLFGGLVAIQFRMQVIGLNISMFLLKMLPYLFTILVLVFVNKNKSLFKLSAPIYLGKPFFKEEK